MRFTKEGFVSDGTTLAEIAKDVFVAVPSCDAAEIVEVDQLVFGVLCIPEPMNDDEHMWLMTNRMQGTTVLLYQSESDLPEEVVKVKVKKGRPSIGLSQGQRSKLRRLVEQGKIQHRWGDPWVLTDEEWKLVENVR